MTLRTIQPIDVRGLAPSDPTTGVPIFEMVDPTTLVVDLAYQRSLGERSVRQIRRIVERFDWTKFSPPICTLGDDGAGGTVLKIIDGQHTAIAAASNPHVAMIPVMIVEAADVQAQAEAFIGQNLDRLGVTKTQMHVAALAAGQEEALAVARVCDSVGIRILKNPPSGGSGYQAGDTVAVAAIEALVKKDGEAAAAFTLSYLAAAELAPIKSDHIKALDLLLTDPQFGAIELESVAEHIKMLGDAALKEAKAFAATHSLPRWKALASVWFKKAKKRRGAAALEPVERRLEGVLPATAGEAIGAQTKRESENIPPDLKDDAREAKGGWTPGNHIRRCSQCDERFRGGRLASLCGECAYGGDDGAIE